MLTRRGFIRGLALAAAAPVLTPVADDAPASTPTPSTTPAWPSDSDPRYWDKLRKQFDLRDDQVFFNTATLGSPPRVVTEAVATSMRRLSSTLAEWTYKHDQPNWISGYSGEDAVRAKLAGLIHADTSELALTQNATMGLS